MNIYDLIADILIHIKELVPCSKLTVPAATVQVKLGLVSCQSTHKWLNPTSQ